MPSTEKLEPCIDQKAATKQQDRDAFVEQSIVRAIDEFDQGHFYESCILLNKCVNVLPEGHNALGHILNYMGIAHSHTGNLDKALTFFKRSVKEDMKHDIYDPTTYMNIIGVLLEQDKPLEALTFFAFLLQRNPLFKLSGNDMALFIPMFVARGLYKEALYIYDTFPLSIDPKDSSHHHVLLVHVGIAHAHLGMVAEASQYFQRYLEKMEAFPDHPHVAMALHHFALLQSRTGNKEQALELSRESVKRYDALDLCADEIQAREAHCLLEELSRLASSKTSNTNAIFLVKNKYTVFKDAHRITA